MAGFGEGSGARLGGRGRFGAGRFWDMAVWFLTIFHNLPKFPIEKTYKCPFLLAILKKHHYNRRCKGLTALYCCVLK